MKEKSELKFLKNKIIELEKRIDDSVQEKNNVENLSEEKFRMLYENSQDPILIIDNYNFVECNDAALKILGLNSQEKIINVHPSKFSPDYQRDGNLSSLKAKEMMDIAYMKGYHRFEWIHTNIGGKEMFMDVSLTKIPNKGKDMIFTVWRDISKQKENENRIIEREKQFSTLFEQAADGILVGIRGGEIVEANESILKLTGYSKKELIGENINKLFEKSELSGKPLRYDLVKTGNAVIRERNIVRKDGKIISIEMKSSVLDDGRMQAMFRDISKRKKAETELLKSKELLQKAESVAGLGRYFYDFKKDVWESSVILNKILGIDENYKKNFKTWLDIIHPDFQKEMLDYFTINIIQNHEAFDKEYKIRRISDQKDRWVHGYGELEFDTSKNPLNLFGTIQDITERKENEIVIKTSEEKYRNIFQNSPLGILHYDIQGIITDCNEHFVNIIGSNKDVLVGLNMLHDLKNTQIMKMVKKSLEEGESYYEDWYESITAIKTTYVRILFKGITDQNNKIVSGIGLVEDITARKKAEQERIISEEKFKSLATLLPEVVYETDIQGNLIFVNFRAYEIFEYTPEDLKKGLNIFQMLAPEELTRAQESLKNINENYKSIGEKYTAITKSGKRFPILVYLDMVKEEGKIIGMRGIIVNIEDLHNTQENLKKSEEKYRLLFENSQDAIFITDSNIFIDCNTKTPEIFGCYDKKEILGKKIIDFYPKYQPDGIESAEKAQKIFKSGFDDKSSSFEWLLKRLDGSSFYSEVSIIPFNIENEQLFQFIVRDISERKEIEQRIVDAVVETEEKERERLASDIHDEIGPLLSSLKMYIESLNKSNTTEKQEFIKSKLQTIIVESINNVREVSNALSPYLLNQHGLIKAIQSFINNSKELINIKFETNIDTQRFGIKHETVYYRIIKELINNTIKHAKANEIQLQLNFLDQELVLTYTDNGVGLKKRNLDNLDIKGMGLYNIINRIKSINGRYKFIDVLPHGFGFELITKANKDY